MKHISSLDGLRGAAVLLVVFFHYFPRNHAGALSQLASIGWVGVDIFFVLSGFLITSILYEQRGAKHYFRNFYMRRVLRLSPLYYFLFVIVLLSTPILHIQWRPLHWAMLFYGANLVLPIDSSLGLIGPFNLFHIWSLAVEEQFYLIWPWLVGLRVSEQTLRRVCIAGILLAPLLRFALLHMHVEPWWIYQSLPTRMDSLLMGALLALIPLPSLRQARTAGGIAILVFGISVWLGHSAFFLSRSIQGIGYSAFALLSASTLVMGLHPATLVSRICSWKVLQFYGRYSYGLYLWHYFLSQPYGLLKGWVGSKIPWVGLAGIVSFILILLVSTTIAVISYHALELPFLRLKSRFSSAQH
ncbi:acyltransferase family protein [Edaphobacter albus]|uniref:acyltransferase family protein n=1 Tax=Edaphobacter sp. 4G125 TaxID=2763071 RepID=UPI001645E560|nr:acyltransferase [Edaphobacter sp. 4G125]QNI35251.1 acyltransferase [Edaphobacter sp. 4G125]